MLICLATIVTALCLNPLDLFCLFDEEETMISAGEPILNESIEKSSFLPINYQTNQIDLGEGKFAQTSYLGFENYKEGNEFKPINMTLIDYGDYWKTIESVYYPTIPKYADEWSEFNNVFEGNNHSIKVRPVAEHTEGIVNGSNVILYPNAFGNGIDLEVTAFKGHFLRKIIIREQQDEKLYFDFEIDIDKKLNYKSVDKNKSKKNIELDSNLKEKKIELDEGKSPTTIYPMKVWDSNGSMEFIDYQLYQKQGKLYFRKEINKEFLENAVYPVYTDDDTGATSPGTMADDDTIGTVPWDQYGSDVNDAKISNNGYVFNYVVETGIDISHYLKATNFGFSIPSDQQIDGILVEIEVHQDSLEFGYIKDSEVKIVKSNGVIGTENKANVEQWPLSDTYFNYGANDDLWSESWEYDDINSANFGVVIAITGGEVAEAPGYLDHIRITVYYTEAPPDTDPPTFSAITDNSTATTPTNGSTVQINITLIDATNVDFYTLSHNDTSDFSWINETFIDVEATTVNVVWNYSIQNFPITGGTLGVRFWANDTLGNSNVSNIHTITVHPIVVDTCTCPTGENWNVDCIDNCSITEECDITGYNLTINGAVGSFDILADIKAKQFAHQKGCKVNNVPNDGNEMIVG